MECSVQLTIPSDRSQQYPRQLQILKNSLGAPFRAVVNSLPTEGKRTETDLGNSFDATPGHFTRPHFERSRHFSTTDAHSARTERFSLREGSFHPDFLDLNPGGVRLAARFDVTAPPVESQGSRVEAGTGQAGCSVARPPNDRLAGTEQQGARAGRLAIGVNPQPVDLVASCRLAKPNDSPSQSSYS
jgi:hypothetical protein